MSYDFNINDAINIKDINIQIEGWYPLVIRYGLYKISEKNFLLWNVKGTRHTFTIPLKTVIEKHAGNYQEHFKLTLLKFREDLIDWIDQDLPENWMKKYYNQFKDLYI